MSKTTTSSEIPTTAGNPSVSADAGPPPPAHPASGPVNRVTMTVEELLERARSGLHRVGPDEARHAQQEDGALLVDLRYQQQRERDGMIPGAVQIERNELEWRLDPRGSHRIPEATAHDIRIVLFCNEGYASSLAAASLQQLGLHRATDLEGGFQAWRRAGFSVVSR